MTSHRARVAIRRLAEAAGQAGELPRIFVAGPDAIQCLQAPSGVSEAYDLMTADGVPPQRAADLAVAAERDGKDPVAFARHFVKLRSTMRDLKAGR